MKDHQSPGVGIRSTERGYDENMPLVTTESSEQLQLSYMLIACALAFSVVNKLINSVVESRTWNKVTHVKVMQ